MLSGAFPNLAFQVDAGRQHRFWARHPLHGLPGKRPGWPAVACDLADFPSGAARRVSTRLPLGILSRGTSRRLSCRQAPGPKMRSDLQNREFAAQLLSSLGVQLDGRFHALGLGTSLNGCHSAVSALPRARFMTQVVVYATNSFGDSSSPGVSRAS